MSNRHYDNMKVLFNFYLKIKKVMLLSEEIIEDFPIAPVNELRNALDHIMRSYTDGLEEEEIDYQFTEAKEHIFRAGYDAFEIIIGYRITQIHENIKSYSISAISEGFPDYHKKIAKEITEIQVLMSTIRAEKGKSDGFELFNQFDIAFERMETIYNEVNLSIPQINAISKKEWRNKIIRIIGAILLVILSVVLTLLFQFVFPLNLTFNFI